MSATVVSGEIPRRARRVGRRRLGDPPKRGRGWAWRSALCAGGSPACPRTSSIVASGLWAAAPVGLALVGTGRSFVSWEHSVLRARVERDLRVRQLSRVRPPGAGRPRLTVAVSEGVARDLRHTFGGARVA